MTISSNEANNARRAILILIHSIIEILKMFKNGEMRLLFLMIIVTERRSRVRWDNLYLDEKWTFLKKIHLMKFINRFFNEWMWKNVIYLLLSDESSEFYPDSHSASQRLRLSVTPLTDISHPTARCHNKPFKVILKTVSFTFSLIRGNRLAEYRLAGRWTQLAWTETKEEDTNWNWTMNQLVYLASQLFKLATWTAQMQQLPCVGTGCFLVCHGLGESLVGGKTSF